jgi:hypothetical protein
MKHGCDEPDKELGASYFFLGGKAEGTVPHLAIYGSS